MKGAESTNRARAALSSRAHSGRQPMYQSFFGLRKRPFAALPDADCFVPLEGVCQAFDGLLQAASEGRGIGVLTAPAGLGKSLVCQRVARELAGGFRVVLLPTGNFLTRRSLLQAILFELGHSFVRMGDQELRLALVTTLRAIRPARRGLVLIVDEAHLLAARMLEELRALLSLGDEGEPLVRLIVSGQLALEETLSRRECDAFNQRIAAQVMLPSLNREESISYLTRRVAWAGANVSELFAGNALNAICEAADGVPRCLHQLADYCLALAVKRSEKPITLRTVREALEDVKQLPLAWAELTVGRATTSPLETARAQAAAAADASIELDGPMAPTQVDPTPARPEKTLARPQKTDREILDEAFFDTYPLREQSAGTRNSFELDELSETWELDSPVEIVAPWLQDSSYSLETDVTQRIDAELAGSAVEFGDIFETEDVDELEANRVVNIERTDALTPNDLSRNPRAIESTALPKADALPESEPRQAGAMASLVDEEVVIDRYAALDSALHRLTRTMLNTRTNVRRQPAEAIAAPVVSAPSSNIVIDAVPQHRFDIVMPEDDAVLSEDDAIPEVAIKPVANTQIAVAATAKAAEPSRELVAASVSAPMATSSTSSREKSGTATDERRPYQLIFSEIRRRRRRG
jgi:type II secretory pathway predicted ATPase ExeA